MSDSVDVGEGEPHEDDDQVEGDEGGVGHHTASALKENFSSPQGSP
jgi:hypothetical protein